MNIIICISENLHRLKPGIYDRKLRDDYCDFGDEYYIRIYTIYVLLYYVFMYMYVSTVFSNNGLSRFS